MYVSNNDSKDHCPDGRHLMGVGTQSMFQVAEVGILSSWQVQVQNTLSF